ncbi:MAG: CRISPR-associated endonuclease Cas2 [Thiothrix sp.]|nr:CRISPR-associated endonuclease Cas2 [Thiothrix sp.]HPE60796.1 CRISPR-associated endonuclease Cas2 [Thiolinea sp.]
MAERGLYLACYDVADDARLRAALLVVRAYATGGQKSVHECWLNTLERGDLLADISLVLNPLEDSFLLVRLDARLPTHTLGQALQPVRPDWFYLG